MRRAVERVWRYSPAALAFALLAVQLWIPFSVPHFATADGPSYVYNALVARDLLFHPGSVYGSVYQFRHAVVPNWGGLVLLNIILTFVPIEYAEQVLMTITLVFAFLSISFLIRTVVPLASPWTPLTNFAIQTLFLWCGFYDFYLSVSAALVLTAWYIRSPGSMTVRRGIILTAGLTVVFLIHLMGAAIAMLAIGLIAIWRWFVEPKHRDSRTAWKQVLLAGACMLPAIAFTIYFAATSNKPAGYQITPLTVIQEFPMDLFNTAGGFFGKQILVSLILTAAIVIAIVRLRRAEWRSLRGSIAALVIASAVLTFSLPDQGFGGGVAKSRFLWTFFIFGIALLAAAPERFRTSLAWVAAILLTINLIATERVVAGSSRAIGDYLDSVDPIPRDSRILRVNYPAPDVEERYGFPGISHKPLLRIDSAIAARCHCIDWSDYQAPNYIFPIVLRSGIPRDQQDRFWHDLETPGRGTEEARWLKDDALGPLDYVIVIADRLSSVSRSGYWVTIATLNEMGMQLTPKARNSPFVRVYARPQRLP
jgi:hypothetical protein